MMEGKRKSMVSGSQQPIKTNRKKEMRESEKDQKGERVKRIGCREG